MNLKEMHEAKQKEQQELLENKEIELQNSELLQIAEKLKRQLIEMQNEKQSIIQNNILLTEQLERATKELKSIDNAEQTLKELEERKKQTEQDEERLKEQKVAQDKRERELNEREVAIADIEEAIKKEIQKRRIEEVSVHQKLVNDAELYKQEQKKLLERRRADYEEEKKRCREKVERTLKVEYKAFKYGLEGYIVALTLVLLVLTGFSVISHPIFLNDLVDFCVSLPDVATMGAEKILSIIPIKNIVVQRGIIAIISFIALVLIIFLCVGIKENMGAWYWSVMALLLALVVFMGEEIKGILNGVNLFGAWIGTVVLTALTWNFIVKIREMRDGVTQDRDKNIIFFVGVTLYGALLTSMF